LEDGSNWARMEIFIALLLSDLKFNPQIFGSNKEIFGD
jgi:hypothetical protein